MEFVCDICNHREEVSCTRPRCDCGGLWRLDYAPPAFDPRLLDGDAHGVFRYRAFLPLAGDAYRAVTLGEGATPIVRLGRDLLVKMDYLMPTLSFKDRGAAVLAAHMKSIGVKRAVQDSSGNAGASVAAYCARAGIECEVYVPQGTSPNKIRMIRAYGAACTVVPGSRERCAEACRSRAMDEGIFYASHVYSPFFCEGTKTYIYEIYEQLGRIPGTLFLPLGNGTLFQGAVRGLEHLIDSGRIARMPRLFAVQSERCAPFYEALRAGLETPAAVEAAPTLAEGIAIGAPARGREILATLRKYDVEVLLAPEALIEDARRALARAGVFVEHTSAATYAAWLAYTQQRGPLGECLLPACGAGLKSEH